jgi:hypothetical protein
MRKTVVKNETRDERKVNTWEVEIRRILVLDQPWQKARPPSQPISWAWWHVSVPVIPAMKEA